MSTKELNTYLASLVTKAIFKREYSAYGNSCYCVIKIEIYAFIITFNKIHSAVHQSSLSDRKNKGF